MMTDEVFCAVIQSSATVTAAVIAAILFIRYEHQKDRLEHAKAFRDLFNEFNKRFSSLNEDLNKIRTASITKTQLPENHLDTIQDYLNLCAEEYLWTKKQYRSLLKPEIWAAWRQGIKFYIEEVPEINYFFYHELTGSAKDSYYGLAQELTEELF